MLQAAPGPIDCVLDLLPPSAATQPVRAAVMTVRQCGRVVLMGGVGMLGGDGLALPYPWIMRNMHHHSRPVDVSAVKRDVRMVGMVRAGLVRLDQFEVTTFGLDHANEAVAHAAANGGPFRMTVMEPN